MPIDRKTIEEIEKQTEKVKDQAHKLIRKTIGAPRDHAGIPNGEIYDLATQTRELCQSTEYLLLKLDK